MREAVSPDPVTHTAGCFWQGMDMMQNMSPDMMKAGMDMMKNMDPEMMASMGKMMGREISPDQMEQMQKVMSNMSEEVTPLLNPLSPSTIYPPPTKGEGPEAARA